MTRPTELLILGVCHLSPDMPDTCLEEAIERLTGWQPQAIAIEVLPGELVEGYARDDDYEGMTAGGFGLARDCAAAASTLYDWPLHRARAVALDPKTGPVDRVIAWCAAYEPYTALLVSRGVEVSPEVRAALIAWWPRGPKGRAWPEPSPSASA